MVKEGLSEEHNSRIETIANLIIQDRTSLDEQDEGKLKKYYEYAKAKFHLEGDPASQLVNEAFLYLKIKSSDGIDPLQHGDAFGAGFS